jgi:hypothetical protein
MPLSSRRLNAQHGTMSTYELHPVEAHGPAAPATTPGRGGAGTANLLLIDPRYPLGLVARANRPWVRLVVRLFGPILDAQLARGRPPESNRFLAARAQILVSPAGRRALVQDWISLLERAGQTPPPRSPRVRPARPAIASCEGNIGEMLALLARPLPISVRGAALASQLLSDGTGPLYRPNGATELRGSLNDVMAQLDPSSSLMPSP